MILILLFIPHCIVISNKKIIITYFIYYPKVISISIFNRQRKFNNFYLFFKQRKNLMNCLDHPILVGIEILNRASIVALSVLYPYDLWLLRYSRAPLVSYVLTTKSVMINMPNFLLLVYRLRYKEVHLACLLLFRVLNFKSKLKYFICFSL